MCVVLLSTSVPAQNKETKLTLTIRNATLESFVRQLENATGFSFVYGEEIKVYRRITLEAKGLTIAEILDRAFANEPVGYEISGKHILLHKRPMPERVKRRRFTISGYLTDKASAETLIGANIVEESLATGTTTNPYGFYSLTLPEGEVNLCFSYLGYEPGYHCFVLEGDTLLNIALESNNCLDEVVVLSNNAMPASEYGLGRTRDPHGTDSTHPFRIGRSRRAENHPTDAGCSGRRRGLFGPVRAWWRSRPESSAAGWHTRVQCRPSAGHFLHFTPEAVKMLPSTKVLFRPDMAADFHPL